MVNLISESLQVKKLRHFYRINLGRGLNNIQRNRCEAQDLITDNNWNCSVEHILGIDNDYQTVMKPQVIDRINKITTEIPAVCVCKNCEEPFDINDKERRKSLRVGELYCSPACKTKLYRKNNKYKTNNFHGN